jgi:hypothetical protein
MPRDFADALAHQSIPDEFLECILTRRHDFPLSGQKRQHVRLQFGPGKADVLELTEYAGTCGKCGCERIMWRDRYTNRYLQSEYKRPDGYDPPPGLLWDRDALWSEYNRRHPVKGRVRVEKR